MGRVAHPTPSGNEAPSFLTDAEVFNLMAALTRGMESPASIADEAIKAVIDFAIEARVKHMLVDMAIRGKVNVCFKKGEVLFQSASGRCVCPN